VRWIADNWRQLSASSRFSVADSLQLCWISAEKLWICIIFGHGKSVVRLEWVPGESCGSKQAYCVIHQSIPVVSQCSLNAWLKGLASGDQCRLMANGSTLEVCYTLMHYTNPYLLYLTLHDVQLNVAQTYVVQRNNSCQQYTVTVLTVHLSVSLLQQYTQPTPFYTYHTSLEAVLYYTSASVRIWVVNFVLTC